MKATIRFFLVCLLVMLANTHIGFGYSAVEEQNTLINTSYSNMAKENIAEGENAGEVTKGQILANINNKTGHARLYLTQYFAFNQKKFQFHPFDDRPTYFYNIPQETFWIFVVIMAMLLVGLTVAIFNIYKKEEYQKELHASREYLRTIFNGSPNLMLIRDAHTLECLDVNKTFIEITGYSAEDILHKKPREHHFVDEYQSLFQVVQDLKLGEEVKNQEIRMQSKNGESLFLLASFELIKTGEDIYLLEAATDITSYKRLQMEINKLDRLNVVGQMAASIGHEIRNPMTTVRGFLQFLGAKPQYKDDVTHFNLMISELDRTNEIITEFLSLARDKKMETELLDLNEIVRTMYPLLAADAIKNNVEVKLDLAESTRNIEGSSNEIRQLILNIARNGIEAMDKYGDLTISTTIKDKEIVLSISDEGPGIPQEVLPKLGTPFFTTKKTGTGLGLAVCYNIAKRHRANIEIESDSSGTTFSFYFPKVYKQTREGDCNQGNT